jgi:hypothetical protein
VTEPYGQWAWVHDCSAEPDLASKQPGLHADGSIALPPSFARHLQALGLIERVNRRFGTLLDFYEEEDVEAPAVLLFLAGALQEAFRGHEIETHVATLVDLLVRSAEVGRCLTFRL